MTTTRGVLCFGLALALFACEEKVVEPPSKPLPALKAAPPDAAPLAPTSAAAKVEIALELAPGLGQPRVLFTADESPYGATLSFDGQETLLLTPKSLVRIPWEGPPTTRSIELGHQRAVRDDSIVFYVNGSFWSISRRGNAAPQRLLARPVEPSALAASGSRVAWTEPRVEGGNALWTLDGGKARMLYATTGSLVALTMLGESVFFVERLETAGWRLGRLLLGGGDPVFLEGRGERTPSMLASGAGTVFYYDGPGRSVRRLRADFTAAEELATGVVCSPLAVSDRVACARLEGLFQVPLDGSKPQALTEVPYGLVASVATSSRRVVWLNDSGRDKLTLRGLELPAVQPE